MLDANGLERAVAGIPGARFEVPTRRNVHRDAARLDAEPGGRVAHDVRLARALRTEPVIDVHRDRAEPRLGRDDQERERVRTTRARDDDRGNEPLELDAFAALRRHRHS